MLPLSLYVYDRAARACAGRRATRLVALSTEPGGVTRVEYSVAGLRTYAPGQFAFLNIPVVSVLQWHPFSISSPPPRRAAAPAGGRGGGAGRSGGDGAVSERLVLLECATVTHHIKAMGVGTWTQALYDLACSVGAGPPAPAGVTVHMEGPYGRAPCDAEARRPDGTAFDGVVLVAGGIGVTPLASLWGAARCAAGTGGGVRVRWRLVWSARTPSLFGAFEDALDAPCAAPDDFTVALYCTGDAAASSRLGAADSVEYYGGGTPMPRTARLLSAARASAPPQAWAGPVPAMRDVVMGRPNYCEVLRGVAASIPPAGAAAARGAPTRLLVWVCGPTAMRRDAEATCTAAMVDSDVTFVYADTTFCW